MQAGEELSTIVNGVIRVAHQTPFPGTGGNLNFITPQLITLGIIPSYAVVSPTQAGAPWAVSETTGYGGTLFVYEGVAPAQGTSAAQFRVSFYYPPPYACIDLLLKGTNCTAGDIGCPLNVATNMTSSGYTYPDAATGWKIMTPAVAANLCAQNAPGGGSVEFWYSL